MDFDGQYFLPGLEVQKEYRASQGVSGLKPCCLVRCISTCDVISRQPHLERALHVGERALALRECGTAGRAAAGGGNASADGRCSRAATGEGVAQEAQVEQQLQDALLCDCPVQETTQLERIPEKQTHDLQLQAASQLTHRTQHSRMKTQFREICMLNFVGQPAQACVIACCKT